MNHTTSGDLGHRRFGWGDLLLCVLVTVAGMAALVGLIGGLQLWWYLDRTTVAEVESMIDQSLSQGASTEEIFAFLDSKHVDHDGSVGQADGDSVLRKAGVHPDTKVIFGLIHDTSREFIITGDIQVYFILNDDYRLEEYLVREVFTGL